MEQNEKSKKLEKLSQALSTELQTIPTLNKEEDCYTVSVYSGELTKTGVAKNFSLIKASFPELDDTYFVVLQKLIVEDGFSDSRLEAAALHVIKTCIYPKPTVANFLSYDKDMKIYTYDQVLNLNDKMSFKAFEFYRPVMFSWSKKPAYVHINDIEKYKLTTCTNKN